MRNIFRTNSFNRRHLRNIHDVLDLCEMLVCRHHMVLLPFCPLERNRDKRTGECYFTPDEVRDGNRLLREMEEIINDRYDLTLLLSDGSARFEFEDARWGDPATPPSYRWDFVSEKHTGDYIRAQHKYYDANGEHVEPPNEELIEAAEMRANIAAAKRRRRESNSNNK